MDLSPPQLALAAFEIALLIFGGYQLVRTFGTHSGRTAFFSAGGLPPWSLGGLEVALLVVLIFLCGAFGQSLVAKLTAARLHASSDRAGLEIAVFGFAFHSLALLGWPVFYQLRQRFFAQDLPAGSPLPPDAPVPPVASAPASRQSWPQVFQAAGLTLAMALPLVAASSFLWTNFLHAVGLPDQPQDLIAIFGNGHSRVVLAGMLLVACVVAPVNEELIFRGAIFRSLRQRFGRVVALVFSGVFFGAIHGNWAGLLPLAILGAALAMAYERTGDLRVSIVTHGLFNLNTVLCLLAGLPQG